MSNTQPTEPVNLARAVGPEAALAEVPSRRCSACGQVKLLDEFSFKSKARGLRVSKCRPCVSEYNHAYHAAHRDRINPKVHRVDRAHRAHLIDLADAVRHRVACGSCGRDRQAGADITLLPPKELTDGRRLSDVVRDGWSTDRFAALLKVTLAHPGGVRCRRCLGREVGLARQAGLRAQANTTAS